MTADSGKGWDEVQSKPRTDSTKAFVAMWFDEEVQAAYDSGIKQAIESDCGYRAVRIDSEHYNGDIVDQVLAEINESRFVVADLTGHRNGVYFEAGYAMGQGKLQARIRATIGKGPLVVAE